MLDPRLAERWYPEPEVGPAPELAGPVREALESILAIRARAAHGRWDPSDDRLHLLNQPPFSLALPIDWDRRSSDDPLWDFQLHGWEWAWPALDDVTRHPAVRDRMQAWSRHHRLGCGLAYEPYPTSRRLVVWSAAAALMDVPSELAVSIGRQTAFLADHLERDLDNNHLIANAKALVWVGVLLPHLPAAERWRALGAGTLWDALEAQVHADGGHEENSSGYHVAVWVDAMEAGLLAGAAGEPVPARSRTTLARMAEFAGALRRPDGRLPLLNDSNEDEPVPLDAAFSLAELLRREDDAGGEPRAAATPAAVRVFPDTGYAVLRAGGEEPESTYLLFDAGNLGPRHCPGHGHADALSIELWSRGQPILLDPGTFQYPNGRWRDYFRSTAAHSTASVDGENQSAFVGPFRVDHMAAARLVGTGEEGETRWAAGEHDGYTRLADPVIHRRKVALIGATRVQIDDVFERPSAANPGRATRHTVAVHFHLAAAEVSLEEPDRAHIRLGSDLEVLLEVESPPPGRLSLEDGWTSRTWYRKDATPTLTHHQTGELPIRVTTRLTIAGPS